MAQFLIDESGRALPAHPDTIAQRFGGRLRSQRPLLPKALGLGFVFLDLNIESAARIALLPHLTTRRALSRAFMLLAGYESERIALSADGLMNHWRLVRGATPAMALLIEIVTRAQQPEPGPFLGSQRLPSITASEIAGGCLVPAIQRWNETGGIWPTDFYSELNRTKLLDSTIIFNKPHESDRFYIEWWGSRRDLYGKVWYLIAPGREVLDQPNRMLGQQEHTLLGSVDGAPQLILMARNLVVRTPDGRLVRRIYKRLMLPWRRPGQRVITTIDVGQRTIVLEEGSIPALLP